MSKYREAVTQMLEENKELFDEFKPIHEAYVINPAVNQAKYNAIGKDVVDVIRDYERKLCAKMGAGQYSKFSMNLSEKFMEEIQKIQTPIQYFSMRVCMDIVKNILA